MKTIALALFLTFLPAALWAEKLALVIGNSDYEFVSGLPNPSNDAQDMAAALERIGFKVKTGIDLDYRQMRLAIRDFSEAAQKAEMVFIYYAGHGIEIDSTNFLIPVNAELRSDRDVELEAIQLNTLVNSIADAPGLKVVLVDACRNNPFVSDMVRSNNTRSIGQGLGRIDPGGVLVGYSARSGTLALDGDGRNSPYMQALLSHIEEPGLEIGKLFRKVRDSVHELTDGYQEPFTYGSLPGRDIFLVPPAQPVALVTDEETEAVSVPDSQSLDQDTMLQDYVMAELARSPEQWDTFIEKYKDFSSNSLYLLALRARNELDNKPLATAPNVSSPGQNSTSEETASLSPAQSVPTTEPAPIVRSLDALKSDLQSELKERGCYRGVVDGIWGRGSAAAVSRFNSFSGASLQIGTNSPPNAFEAAIQQVRATGSAICVQQPQSASVQPAPTASADRVAPTVQNIETGTPKTSDLSVLSNRERQFWQTMCVTGQVGAGYGDCARLKRKLEQGKSASPQSVSVQPAPTVQNMPNTEAKSLPEGLSARAAKHCLDKKNRHGSMFYYSEACVEYRQQQASN